MTFLVLFFSAFLLALVFTPAVKMLAWKYNIIDYPRPPRNLHSQPIPFMGGVAIYASFALVVICFLASGLIDQNILPHKFIWATLLGGLILIIGGTLDDKFTLSPKVLWLFPMIASIVVVMSGIGVGIKELSNPFGEPIRIDHSILGIPLSALVMIVWLNGMIFTTKFLDGLDGLVAGIGMIAGLTLFTLSLTARVNQDVTASLAIIFVGALAGYLIYAFNPASIFLGESGSTLVGFILGVLAIILGGKIATALLVMGIPILDVGWVIIQRLRHGQSPFRGDRLHLHFQLLDLGFSQKQTALVLYGISAAFGFTAVFLQSMGKLVALGILVVLMMAIVAFTVRSFRRRQIASD